MTPIPPLQGELLVYEPDDDEQATIAYANERIADIDVLIDNRIRRCWELLRLQRCDRVAIHRLEINRLDGERWWWSLCIQTPALINIGDDEKNRMIEEHNIRS